MNKLPKIKKAIFIVLPLLMAIYQVYLVNRIWDFSKKITLMMGIFLICALYFVFYLFYKRINYKSVEKKSFIKIFIVSILLTLVIIGSNFDFFAKKFTESTVEISYENQEEGTMLPIRNVVIDNRPVNLGDEQKTSPTTLSFEKAKDIIIVFEEKQNNETVKIKDGQKEKEIDLYSYKDDIYAYNVESNETMSFFSVIRLVLSFAMIEFLSVMFCVASYYLYKEKKSLLLPVLFIIAVVQMIFYKQCIPYTIYTDSLTNEASYTKEQILSGQLLDRTPIYPITLRIFRMICGNELGRNFVCIAQIIISFISLIYMYKTLKLLIKWEPLVAIITFLYGVSLAVIGWNSALLTESFALSGTIWFCYFIISYIKVKKLKYGILATIMAFLITYTRPANIVYIVILFAFFLVKAILDKEERKKDIKCLILSTVTICFTLVYATVFYMQHDIFSITEASVRQDLYVCMSEGFYKNSKDEQFVKDVDAKLAEKNGSIWDANADLLKSYGNKRIQELVKEARKESSKEYIQYLVRLITNSSTEYFTSYFELYLYNNVNNIPFNFVNSFNFLKFSTVYLILVIECVLSIYRWIKNKKPDWINLGLFGFILAILVTSFIGTNAEFMRTAICVVPFCYIAIGTLVWDVIKKYEKERLETKNG